MSAVDNELGRLEELILLARRAAAASGTSRISGLSSVVWAPSQSGSVLVPNAYQPVDTRTGPVEVFLPDPGAGAQDWVVAISDAFRSSDVNPIAVVPQGAGVTTWDPSQNVAGSPYLTGSSPLAKIAQAGAVAWLIYIPSARAWMSLT
jgi:hypothetical protein